MSTDQPTTDPDTTVPNGTEPNDTDPATADQPAQARPAPFDPKSTWQLRRDAETIASAAAAAGTPMTDTEAWNAAHRQEEARANAYLDSVGLGWVDDTAHDAGSSAEPGPDAWQSPDPAVDEAEARRARRYAAEAAADARQRRDTDNAILAGADRLDPNDHSIAAEQLRETAEDIRDHREAAARRGEPIRSELIAEPDPFTNDAMQVARGDDLPPSVRFGQMSDTRVETVRSVLATLPDQFTMDDLAQHGITLDEASLVYMADAGDLADSAVTDPWRPPATEPWRTGTAIDATEVLDPPAADQRSEVDAELDAFETSVTAHDAREVHRNADGVVLFDPDMLIGGPGRYGATVDPNGQWTDHYFATAAERDAWLDYMDLGVRELIEPDGTRHLAELNDEGRWVSNGRSGADLVADGQEALPVDDANGTREAGPHDAHAVAALADAPADTAAYTVRHEDRVVAETDSPGEVLRVLEDVVRQADEFPTVTLRGERVPGSQLLSHLFGEARPAADTAAERDWAAGVARYMELQLFPPDDARPGAVPADWNYADAGTAWGRATGTPPPQVVLDALNEAAQHRLGVVRSDIVQDAALAVVPDAMVVNRRGDDTIDADPWTTVPGEGDSAHFDRETEHEPASSPLLRQFDRMVAAEEQAQAEAEVEFAARLRRSATAQEPAAVADSGEASEAEPRKVREQRADDGVFALDPNDRDETVPSRSSAEARDLNDENQKDTVPTQRREAAEQTAETEEPAADAKRQKSAALLEQASETLERAATACARIDQALATEERYRADEVARARAVEMTHDDTVSRTAGMALEVADGGA